MEKVEIARKDAPDVRFEGNLLWEADSRESTRQDRREKTRWTRLAIWELAAGGWVVASVAVSEKPGEVTFGDVLALPASMPAAERQRAAMTFWGHSWLAKGLAAKAGWDVAEVLE